MINFSNQKIKYRINCYQIELKRFYINNQISDNDIMNIFSLNSTEFLSILKTRKNDVKFSFFSSLYFSPYILCDQEYLSEGLKKLLPIILNTRFNMEMDELNYYYNNGMINKKEYNQTKENLIYSYYETTEDGKKIFKDFNENGTNKQKSMI